MERRWGLSLPRVLEQWLDPKCSCTELELSALGFNFLLSFPPVPGGKTVILSMAPPDWGGAGAGVAPKASVHGPAEQVMRRCRL